MSKINLTIISQCNNEQFLLPEWINYHKEIFDHGVIYDYASTDKSVEIINALAPTWEVRQSKNKYFGSGWFNGVCAADNTDRELMEAEREHVGPKEWKICLNITEFLFAKDVKTFLEKQPDDVNGISTHGVWVVDPPELEDVYPESPILKNRHHGFSYEKSRCRLIHRYPDAKYKGGRHEFIPGNCGYTDVLPYIYTQELMTVCLRYSPWVKEFKQRKIDVNKKLVPGDTGMDFATHLSTLKDMQRQIVDLRTFEPYNDIYKYKYENGV